MSTIREQITLGLARPALWSAFASSPERWLPQPTRRVGPSRYALELHAGPAHHQVAVDVGAVWSRDGGRWRRLRWTPVTGESDVFDADRMLPGFSGELGLMTGASEDTLDVVLVGHYRPPGGPIGAALDRVALRAVAHVTAGRLLADVRARLRLAADELDAEPEGIVTDAARPTG